MKKKVAVIGAGFAGLSAATYLAARGFDVTLFEKNALPGGRARKMEAQGFTFDLGPSWYWMPEVFEKYFNLFGKSVSDYYQLHRLDPSYRIVYGKDDYLDLPAGETALYGLFERLEPGSSEQLRRFLAEGKYKYEIGINKLVYKPGLSLAEFADAELLTGVFKLHVFQSVASYVRKFFKEPRLVALLEFPVLFLGATAQNIPALYTLMNYADMALGTWYPQGGMYEVVKAMARLAEEKGVTIAYHSAIEKIKVEGNRATGVQVNNQFHPFDYVVAGADYHHVEQQLLPASHRQYSETYWNNRTMAPSSLLFYIGLNKKLEGLQHHTLFFDQDFGRHASEIYARPQWPTSPQFYLSVTSKTDNSVAPEGCENLVILIPVAPGLADEEATREKYFDMVMARLENLIGQQVRPHIVFKRSYAHRDFTNDYNSFKGNAYGLANTLWQTAHLKPSVLNKKVRNLFFTGQLTVPGPGVPPSIISGQVVARLVERHAQRV
jgi:phytoene desaturase